jgi:hypothetical protein
MLKRRGGRRGIEMDGCCDPQRESREQEPRGADTGARTDRGRERKA